MSMWIEKVSKCAAEGGRGYRIGDSWYKDAVENVLESQPGTRQK